MSFKVTLVVKAIALNPFSMAKDANSLSRKMFFAQQAFTVSLLCRFSLQLFDFCARCLNLEINRVSLASEYANVHSR